MLLLRNRALEFNRACANTISRCARIPQITRNPSLNDESDSACYCSEVDATITTLKRLLQIEHHIHCTRLSTETEAPPAVSPCRFAATEQIHLSITSADYCVVYKR